MCDTKKLIEQLSEQMSPVMPLRPQRYALQLLFLLALYAVLTQGWLGLRPDLSDQLKHPLFILELFLLIAMLVSAAIAAIYSMLPDLNQRPYLLRLPYLFTGLMLGVIGMQLLLPQIGCSHAQDVPSHTLECALFIACSSMLPAMLIFMWLRKGAPVLPKNAGALAAIASLSIGLFTLRIAEENDCAPHLLAWHYLPSALCAILGAFCGKYLLRW